MPGSSRSLPGLSRRRAAFLLIVGAALWGCRREAANEAGSSETDAAVPTAGTACTATAADIRGWIESPSVPADPAGTSDACYFNFAWQQFFAMTRLQDGVPLFATWPDDQALFPASGDAQPWRTGPGRLRARQLRKGLGLPIKRPVTADQVEEAAALTPLVDQRGRWLHFSVLVDQQEYEYIRCCELYRGGCFNARSSGIELPTPSLELKLAWRVLETCDLPDSPSPCTPDDASRFLAVQGEVQPYSAKLQDKPVQATLGLVGLHIVQKTPQNPDFLWATFEHRDNAPDCPPEGSPAPSPPAGFTGWQLYDAACQDPTGSGRCQNNWYCPPCPVAVSKEVRDTYNAGVEAGGWTIPPNPADPSGGGLITCTPLPHTFNRPIADVQVYLFDPDTCQAAQVPTQVCRTTPITSEVRLLNEQVRQVLGELGGRSAVLANYELAGVLWFSGGTTLQPASGTALANTTMETYLQDPKLMPKGCLMCHTGEPNPVPSEPPMQFDSGLADRSMAFQQIRQYGGTCSQSLPAHCSTWVGRCPAG